MSEPPSLAMLQSFQSVITWSSHSLSLTAAVAVCILSTSFCSFLSLLAISTILSTCIRFIMICPPVSNPSSTTCISDNSVMLQLWLITIFSVTVIVNSCLLLHFSYSYSYYSSILIYMTVLIIISSTLCAQLYI